MTPIKPITTNPSAVYTINRLNGLAALTEIGQPRLRELVNIVETASNLGFNNTRSFTTDDDFGITLHIGVCDEYELVMDQKDEGPILLRIEESNGDLTVNSETEIGGVSLVLRMLAKLRGSK